MVSSAFSSSLDALQMVVEGAGPLCCTVVACAFILASVAKEEERCRGAAKFCRTAQGAELRYPFSHRSVMSAGGLKAPLGFG